MSDSMRMLQILSGNLKNMGIPHVMMEDQVFNWLQLEDNELQIFYDEDFDNFWMFKVFGKHDEIIFRSVSAVKTCLFIDRLLNE